MVKRTKDDGIATLVNGVKLPEGIRDELMKHNWQEPRRKTSGFDPSNSTTAELKEHKFSGFRVNQFTQDLELWLLGDMRARRRLRDCTPKAVADMHEEVFATSGTILEFELDDTDKANLAKVKQQKARRAKHGNR